MKKPANKNYIVFYLLDFYHNCAFVRHLVHLKMESVDSVSFKSMSVSDKEEKSIDELKVLKTDIAQNLTSLRLDVKFICMSVEKISLKLEDLDKLVTTVKSEQSKLKFSGRGLHKKVNKLQDIVSQIQEDVSKFKNTPLRREVSFDLDRNSSISTETIEQSSFNHSLNRTSSNVSSDDMDENRSRWKRLMKYISLDNIGHEVCMSLTY